MGDRANIKVVGMGDVYLYSHWSGSELPMILKDALLRGRDRWTDPQYLTRIIFCEMIQDDVFGETGYGISGKCGDGDDRVLTVDVNRQMVKWPSGTEMSFENYLVSDVSWGYQKDGEEG